MKLIRLLFFLLFPALALAQGNSNYSNIIFSSTGKPLAGGYITVCSTGAVGIPCSPTVNIFDANGAPLANPIRTDSLGNFSFWAPSGIYTYTATGNGVVATGPFTIVLPCISGQACTTSSQFPWIQLNSTSTPILNVGNGNVSYGMAVTSNITSVTLAGTPQNGNYLAIKFQQDNIGGHTISTGVFPANVLFPVGFSFNTAASSAYWLSWTYDSFNGDWEPMPVWGGTGAGTSFYQTVQNNGTGLPQEPILNCGGLVVCSDDPGNNRTNIGVPAQNYGVILNNAVALPVEPALNLVPPLVATDNSGNSRTDITCPAAVGVGGSHASGCVPDPGASGTSTDYLGRDMGYHTSVSAATVKPVNADAIQYVTAEGNDTNDGLSYGSAKLDIYTAICSLPTGNCSTQLAGAGTVYVTTGSSANLTGTAGIWLMNGNDPNYSSPPAGWLKCHGGGSGCNLNIVGIPNANSNPNPQLPRIVIGAGSSADNNHPWLWISGGGGNIAVSNMTAPGSGRGIVLGECSNGVRTGQCLTTSVVLTNVAGNANSGAGSGTIGPGIDITGGSFWIWLRDVGAIGNAYAATGGRTANNAAAILIDGTGNLGNGFIYISDGQLAAGGIKFIPGANGGNLYVSNTIEEGDFAHDIPPTVWFTNWVNGMDAQLVNIQTADPGSTPTPTIQIDANGVAGPEVVGVNGENVQGPATILGENNSAVLTAIKSPLSNGQAGFFNTYVVGKSNSARRLAGLAPVRALNKAKSDSTTWTATGGGLITLTTGQTDPFGGTNATSATSSTGTNQELYLTGTCTANTYVASAGDWIVGGVWVKGASPTQNWPAIDTCGTGPLVYSVGPLLGRPQITGDGEWEWLTVAGKVTSGGSVFLSLGMLFNSTLPITAYGPVLNVISSGTMSDNEVYEYVNTFNSVDSACAVGSICNVAGHPVSADQYQIRAGGFATTISSATLAANRAITIPDPLASGIIPVVTGSITTAHSLCASGTLGVYIDCAGGGGSSGTTIASAQFSLPYYDQPGSVAHLAGIPAPTSPNGVPNFWVTIPSGGLATAQQAILAGIPGRSVSGASDTILATDRVSEVTYTNAGATAISLPGAGTTGFGSNFCFKMIVQGSSAVATITPASGTINGGATQAVLQGQKALVCSFDNSNWIASISDPPATAGTAMNFSRGDTSLTFNSTAGGGTVTHTAGALTAGQLMTGNGAGDATVGDISGDCTTSGSTAITCTKLNGTAFSGTNGNLVKFGAANVPADSSVVAANVITSTGSLASGNVVNGASPKTVTDSGIASANLVTAASNAGFANQLCASGGANKACAFTSLADISATDYMTTSGSVNVLAGCPTDTAAALTTGMKVKFLPNLANTTTTPTFNLCTKGAKTITKAPGVSALVANDLVTAAIADVVYDGTEWQLQNPQTSSGGGGSTAISSLTAAAASNTTATNGDFVQTWPWAQTSNGSAGNIHAGLSISESGASTGGTVTTNLSNQAQLLISNTAASTATPLAIQQGSVTGTVPFPAAQFSTTWNNAGLTAQGIVLAVTNTASLGGSKLINLLAGASGTTSQFSVDENGVVTTIGGLRSHANYLADTSTTSLIYQGGQDSLSAGNTNGSATFRGANNTSTTASSAAGAATLNGGDETAGGGNALIGGNTIVRGGNLTNATGTASTAGNVTVQGGDCRLVTSASVCPGKVKVLQVYFNTGTTNVNDLACVTAANTVASCAAGGGVSLNMFIGVIDSVQNSDVLVASIGAGGTHTFNATSATFTNGHFVCQDSTNGNLVVDSATVCTAGQGVGMYIGATGTTTTPLVAMRPY